MGDGASHGHTERTQTDAQTRNLRRKTKDQLYVPDIYRELCNPPLRCTLLHPSSPPAVLLLHPSPPAVLLLHPSPPAVLLLHPSPPAVLALYISFPRPIVYRLSPVAWPGLANTPVRRGEMGHAMAWRRNTNTGRSVAFEGGHWRCVVDVLCGCGCVVDV